MRFLIAALATAIFVSPVYAGSVTASPASCSSTACVSGTLQAWGAPSNALTSNNSWASKALSAGQVTECLYCVFGANLTSVPSGADIQGITVNVERSRTNTGIYDEYVQLVTDDGTLSGDNKASLTTWNNNTDTIVAYGGTTDTWGLTGACATNDADCDPTAYTNILDTQFGVIVVAENQAGAGATAWVDHVQMVVEYTECCRSNVYQVP